MEKGSGNAAAITDPTVKKLYRACMECVKLLDQNMKGKTDAQSLCSLTPVRNKLRECCEKLLFLNPLEFGRKADEILWRKCHYEPIKVLRQHSLALSNESKCFLNTMLTSAIGYYQLLSLKLQRLAPGDKVGRIDFQASSVSPIIKKGQQTAGTTDGDPKLREWFIGELHRILIYQGDLARYLYEIDGTADIRMAQHYYHQALILKPFHGTPHNQLGTLFLTANYGLDATYYYLRSILSREHFAGAGDNLLDLLKKNEQALRQFLSDYDGQQEPNLEGFTPETDMKYFSLVFLSAVQVLYLDEPLSNDNGIVQQSCGKTIRAFVSVLRHPLSVDQQQQIFDSSILEADLLGKIFIIQILLIGKLQDKGSLKLSPAIALLVSMFANFLNHIVNGFCGDYAGGVNDTAADSVSQSSTKYKTVGTTSAPGSEKLSVARPPSAKRKPILTRRRRREEQEDDDDENGKDYESDSSSESSVKSENELNCGTVGIISSSDSDDIIELSDNELSLANLLAQNEKNGNGDAKSEVVDSSAQTKATQSSNVSQSDVGRKPWIELSPSEKIEILATYGLLVPLKIVCDWFRCNQAFLLMVHQNAGDLWASLARVLNFLPDDRQLSNYLESDRKLSVGLQGQSMSSLNDWIQKIPLPEDVMLRGVSSLNHLHGNLDYSAVVCGTLETETILRIGCVRAFGHHLIRSNTPSFRFDHARMEFIATTGQTLTQDNAENDKKTALMRSMAQLRLKEELASAEKMAWIPVYVIPDANALCHKLSAVKKLASAQKFIVVIPTSTIDDLDRMKKDSGSARMATRWLESQFQRGNQFVRVQKSTERDDSLLVDKATVSDVPGNFLEILKCAAQLRKLVKAGTTSGSTIVTVLTSFSRSGAEFKRMEELLQTAALPGVTLANASHFCNLWDSHRKKR